MAKSVLRYLPVVLTWQMHSGAFIVGLLFFPSYRRSFKVSRNIVLSVLNPKIQVHLMAAQRFFLSYKIFSTGINLTVHVSQ